MTAEQEREAAADADELAALRADFGHDYTIGHDSDGVWWSVRKDVGIAPLESGTPDGLRAMLAGTNGAACERRS